MLKERLHSVQFHAISGYLMAFVAFPHSAAGYHWMLFWALEHLLLLYFNAWKTAIVILKLLTATADEMIKINDRLNSGRDFLIRMTKPFDCVDQ
jgi:hypothetical protein